MVGRIFKSLLIFLFLAPVAKAGSSSPNHKFGLGFVLGAPTALSAKYWTSGTTALDFALGWGLGYGSYDDHCWDADSYNRHKGYCDDRGYYYGDDRYGYRGLHLHADYLFHDFGLIRSSEKFPIYYGPGINLNVWNHGGAQLGLRGVIGIAWMPRAKPFDVFLELAPVLQLFPATWVDVNAGFGGRFYF